MKQAYAFQTLATLADKGRVVFSTQALATIFRDDAPRTFQAALPRLVASGLLQRATNGVYVYGHHTLPRDVILQRVAGVLRAGNYSYISLESALSRHDRISQMPMDRLTIMTTGRSGEVTTPYGVLEFTHTARQPKDFFFDVLRTDDPLPLANARLAERDLRRVGRNVHMLNEESCDDE